MLRCSILSRKTFIEKGPSILSSHVRTYVCVPNMRTTDLAPSARDTRRTVSHVELLLIKPLLLGKAGSGN